MRKRNKLLTLLLFSTNAALATASLNKAIKINATQKNLLASNPDFSCYSWRLGNVYYKKAGSGKPLLLIHDLTAISASYEWDQLIPLLAKHYTVYAIDLLGCGRSEKINTTYTNYLYVQLITNFIKSEIGHRTNVIATGESSSIPIMACSNEPELFNHIMLINPLKLSDFCFIPGKTAKLYKKIVDTPILGTLFYYIAVSRKFIEQDAATKKFHNKSCIKSSWIDLCYEASHTGFSPKSLYGSQKCNYTKCNITNSLKKIDNSICLVGGKEIEDISSRLEEYKTCNPAIEISYIPETKYLPQWESPEKLFQLIKTYFG